MRDLGAVVLRAILIALTAAPELRLWQGPACIIPTLLVLPMKTTRRRIRAATEMIKLSVSSVLSIQRGRVVG